MASKKLITFDPTIHAGHVLTAITIIVSAAAIWFGTLNTVANHETALKQHTQRMDNIEAHASAERERTDRKFDSLVQDNNQALNKLRDDMQGWFMALSDKLDRKADKR
jgi:hypothetical protein